MSVATGEPPHPVTRTLPALAGDDDLAVGSARRATRVRLVSDRPRCRGQSERTAMPCVQLRYRRHRGMGRHPLQVAQATRGAQRWGPTSASSGRETMPSARDAREWAAAGGLHGIGDSLYTPFSGPDGDEIDFDAYRTLVRYCVDDLGHEMLWLTSGIAEWWSLTMDE